jgi:uncharacterized sulfatase
MMTAPTTGTSTNPAKQNTMLILVDEMRFPSVFPEGIEDADGFLKAFMPNVFSLWQKGVKFSNYLTAANACTPARGTLLTGLYSQQTWLCCTLTNDPVNAYKPSTLNLAPSLNPAFPTLGKMMIEAGYQTPYVGKFHIAHDVTGGQREADGQKYGFDLKMNPDMAGFNLQGTVGSGADYLNDKEIAGTAVAWLKENARSEAPWFLTVSFVNPHDKQFFWGGTEFVQYNALFQAQSVYTPLTYYSTESGPGAPVINPADNPLADPPSYGYPAVPPNWESMAQLTATKPSTVSAARTIQAGVWGDASDDAACTSYSITAYPPTDALTNAGKKLGVGVAPFGYWRRGLDSYTQILSIVDQRIGEVLNALPADVADRTLIVFASDHGEYAGAHGLMSGKIMTTFNEAWNIPLIVVDPSGRYTDDVGTVRDGLVSSVDMLRMFVSLGRGGSQDWLTGDYETLWGKRHDVLPMLKSAAAPGREQALLVTDEVFQGYFLDSAIPTHVIGLQTAGFKLGTYALWAPDTDTIKPDSVETELYDYATPGGRAELDNDTASPLMAPATDLLFNRLLQEELRAPLPASLHEAQEDAKQAYLRFSLFAAHAPVPKKQQLEPVTALGGCF